MLDLDAIFRSVGGQSDADGANDPDVGPLLHLIPAADLSQSFVPRFKNYTKSSDSNDNKKVSPMLFC